MEKKKRNSGAKGLHNYYKRSAVDLLMYGYIKAMTKHLPYTIDFSIMNFKKEFELYDDYPLESLRITYFRMQKEYFVLQRTDQQENG